MTFLPAMARTVLSGIYSKMIKITAVFSHDKGLYPLNHHAFVMPAKDIGCAMPATIILAIAVVKLDHVKLEKVTATMIVNVLEV